MKKPAPYDRAAAARRALRLAQADLDRLAKAHRRAAAAR
jgi:hypothetical protein